MVDVGYTKSTPPTEEQMHMLHMVADTKALIRIFLDSLNNCQYEECIRGIENACMKGRNIYPIDVAEALD